MIRFSGPQCRNELTIGAVALGWALCFDAALLVIKKHWLPPGPILWVVAALPSVAALGVLMAYTRYLRRADELQRLIQLQAMSWAFGGGFFVICGYLLFQHLGAPRLDQALLASLMPVLYAIGLAAGWRRYR
jgi:hypothetical protein